ncbi:MAG: glycosyltransferase [Pseudomonadota bacterium]
MTSLLVLSVSAGNGHVRAAQALCAAADARGLAGGAVHVDAMAHMAPGFRWAYTDAYLQLVRCAPGLWSYIHQKTDSTPHSAMSQRLRRAVERASAGALLREVHRLRPAAIVCTHFLPAELLMRERSSGRLDCPVWLQVTDYDLHNMWLVPGMAGYLAATDEVAFRMRARGLAPARLHVTGIPVMPGFSRVAGQSGQGDQSDKSDKSDQSDRNVQRESDLLRLGLDPSRRVVLMTSGGSGIGDLPAMVARALALDGPGCDFQLVAVAGRNARALAALQALALRHPGRLLPVGFTDEMHAWMAAADLVVTKPGGLTISECLALGRPMLLVAPIPGQEEHNAGFLLEAGAACLAYDAIGLDYKLAALMAAPDKLLRMAQISRALGRPDAAQRVLDHVFGAEVSS